MFDNKILILGFSLLAAQYLFAGISGSLTPAQMRTAFPGESILPLLWHGGVWYDLPLTFYIAWLSKRHPEWSSADWTFTLALGFAASWYMHFMVYAPATRPNLDPGVIVTQEAHVQNGEVMFVGMLQLVFFQVAVATILNEVLFSKQPSFGELAALGAFLVGLLFVGNHMVLGLIKLLTDGSPVDYRGEPLKSAIGWSSVLGGAGVAAFVCIARGVFRLW